MSNQKALPHVYRIDLKKDGILEEVIILKKDEYNGDIYYIASSDLDDLDKKRMIKILSRDNAKNLPLWDLLSREILGNGQNALEFFHQLAKIRTAQGKILPVGSGKMGARVSYVASEYDETNDGNAQAAKKRGRPPIK